MGLAFRSHLQRGQCSGRRLTQRMLVFFMGVSGQLIGPIFKVRAAQGEFLFDSVGPAMQELSRSNRRLEQISYDRNVTALYYPQTKRNALFKIYALYAYIRLSEPFCRALTVTVKYTCHESAKIQVHEFWIILPYGFILRQKLRQTRRGVSV